MAQKNQMRTPSGVAGLVRYDEDDHSYIKMKPMHVAAIAIVIVVIEAIMLYALPL
ncbi:MAG: preprotein translocase subunit Sec61beta [Candidatus Woesearchaeota archaeon]